MRTKTIMVAGGIAFLMLFATLFTSGAWALEKVPPLVNQLYDGNWPSAEEGQKLRDELFYQRAIHAYMMMLPALNTIGMRDGSEAVFGAGYNVLPIWKDRMGAQTWVPTPNADVIYCPSPLVKTMHFSARL